VVQLAEDGHHPRALQGRSPGNLELVLLTRLYGHGAAVQSPTVAALLLVQVQGVR
jgi:hypothetical protein